MTSVNMASHLAARAATHPRQYAVVEQHTGDVNKRFERALTYRQLHEQSDRVAAGLMEHGIVKGTRTVLMVRPGLDFFVLVFALFKIEAVLVAVDPGMGMKNLGRCLSGARPQAFIGINRAHLARVLLAWGRSTLRTHIVIGSLPFGLIHPTLDQLRKTAAPAALTYHDTAPGTMAAILFTSGSTGAPKGVVYSHANFSAQVSALQSLYQFRPAETDLATFPLFALFAPVFGMTSIIPRMDFTRPASVDPETIISAIRDYQCSSMFGSPALLNRVASHYAGGMLKLTPLKRVLSAGAPVSPAILEGFQRLLENDARIYTPYGATESLPVSSVGSLEILNDTAMKTASGAGVCVGRAVKGMDIQIIRITDDIIAEWSRAEVLARDQIGEICVRAAQVTASYYRRDRATRLARVKAGNGFYHRMGDTGYLDGQDRLWFCGRKNERLVLGDTTLHTVCCEGVFNAHAAVCRAALVGVKRGQNLVPVICIELEQANSKDDKRRLSRELLDLAGRHRVTRAIHYLLFHPGFPVDIRHNAKINRARLGLWAGRQLS